MKINKGKNTLAILHGLILSICIKLALPIIFANILFIFVWYFIPV